VNFENLNNQKSQKKNNKNSAPAYVFEKHRELVCNECQGRGECFLCDSDRKHKQEPQEVFETRKTKRAESEKI